MVVIIEFQIHQKIKSRFFFWLDKTIWKSMPIETLKLNDLVPVTWLLSNLSSMVPQGILTEKRCNNKITMISSSSTDLSELQSVHTHTVQLTIHLSKFCPLLYLLQKLFPLEFMINNSPLCLLDFYFWCVLKLILSFLASISSILGVAVAIILFWGPR